MILVNPDKWPKVNAAGGRAFSDFVLSAEGQTLIGAFGVAEFGGATLRPRRRDSEDNLAITP